MCQSRQCGRLRNALCSSSTATASTSLAFARCCSLPYARQAPNGFVLELHQSLSWGMTMVTTTTMVAMRSSLVMRVFRCRVQPSTTMTAARSIHSHQQTSAPPLRQSIAAATAQTTAFGPFPMPFSMMPSSRAAASAALAQAALKMLSLRERGLCSRVGKARFLGVLHFLLPRICCVTRECSAA